MWSRNQSGAAATASSPGRVPPLPLPPRSARRSVPPVVQAVIRAVRRRRRDVAAAADDAGQRGPVLGTGQLADRLSVQAKLLVSGLLHGGSFRDVPLRSEEHTS